MGVPLRRQFYLSAQRPPFTFTSAEGELYAQGLLCIRNRAHKYGPDLGFPAAEHGRRGVAIGRRR